MLANYHTHTKWCKHGMGEIEEYIETAISSGLRELAITEHVPHKDNLDARRIQWEEFNAYDLALNDAIQKYKDQIHVIKGFECEFYPEELDTYQMFREKYGYELLILGQHRSGRKREIDNFARKTKREMQVYADEVCAGLETGIFDFLAHPDLALQGYPECWDKTCESVMRQIFRVCEEKNVPLEINANGLLNKMAYPNENAFLLSKEYQLRYIINSDAHRPQDLYGPPIDAAEEFAQRLGLPVMKLLRKKEQEVIEYGKEIVNTGSYLRYA